MHFFAIILPAFLMLGANGRVEVPDGWAHVNIQPGSSNTISGSLDLTAIGLDVHFKGIVSGLTPGLHGFHVHENGLLTNKCKDAGGHFNPYKQDHGDINADIRHVGDLGNIEADAQGNAHVDIVDPFSKLDHLSPSFIGNLAVVVHAKADDLGLGGNAESRKTGNAGARVGCGIIKIVKKPVTPDAESSGSYQTPGIIPAVAFQRPRNQYLPPYPGSVHIVPTILVPVQSQFVPNYHGFNQQLPPYQPDFAESARGNNGIKRSASVKIIPGSSKSVGGYLEIREEHDGVTIDGYINGLKPGFHGFHIHEKGDLGNECRNAKGHFNPFDATHGDPNNFERHVGDLGNVKAEFNGVASIYIFDPKASLDPHSEAYIGNRALVVHADQDDLGRGGDRESLITGNAGARVGCGVIKVLPSASGFHNQRQHFINFPSVPVYVPRRMPSFGFY